MKLFLCSAVVSLGGREGGPARFLKGEAVIIYSTERGSLRLIFYVAPAKIEFPKYYWASPEFRFGTYSVYYNVVVFYSKTKTMKEQFSTMQWFTLFT